MLASFSDVEQKKVRFTATSKLRILRRAVLFICYFIPGAANNLISSWDLSHYQGLYLVDTFIVRDYSNDILLLGSHYDEKCPCDQMREVTNRVELPKVTF